MRRLVLKPSLKHTLPGKAFLITLCATLANSNPVIIGALFKRRNVPAYS